MTTAPGSQDWREPLRRLKDDYRRGAQSARHGSGVLSTFLTVKFVAVSLFRLSQAAGSCVPILGHALKQLNHLITGADIAWQAEIGPGLQLFHPTGVVVGPEVRIGADCSLQQGVTLGHAWSRKRGMGGSPTLGAQVVCGPGARVLGAITLGQGVVVAPNSVVTRDVPDRAVARGIPATW